MPSTKRKGVNHAPICFLLDGTQISGMDTFKMLELEDCDQIVCMPAQVDQIGNVHTNIHTNTQKPPMQQCILCGQGVTTVAGVVGDIKFAPLDNLCSLSIQC